MISFARFFSSSRLHFNPTALAFSFGAGFTAYLALQDLAKA
jgi:hypothetical protein